MSPSGTRTVTRRSNRSTSTERARAGSAPTPPVSSDWERAIPLGQWYDISEAEVVDGAAIPLEECDQIFVGAGGTRVYCAGATGDVWAVDTATRERIGPTIRTAGRVNTVSATRGGERVVVTAFGPDGRPRDDGPRRAHRRAARRTARRASEELREPRRSPPRRHRRHPHPLRPGDARAARRSARRAG